MDLDHLLIGFFGTTELADFPSDLLASGVDRLRLQLGLERDGGRRLALWCLAYMLGVAPAPDTSFEEEAERVAARDFMDAVDRGIDDGERP